MRQEDTASHRTAGPGTLGLPHEAGFHCQGKQKSKESPRAAVRAGNGSPETQPAPALCTSALGPKENSWASQPFSAGWTVLGHLCHSDGYH